MVLLSTVTIAASIAHQDLRDQRAIAEKLLSGDSSKQTDALGAVRAMGARNADPELRQALITLLERQNRLARQNIQRGESVEGAIAPEFRSRLCQTVAELRDPRTIPVLADSLGGGFVVHRHLAAFGENAAGPVLAVVMAQESDYEAVNEGLVSLRFMVENQRVRPLRNETLQLIRSAAQQHLTRPGRPPGTGVTIRWAIDLAVALKDPALRRIVESLASSPAEIMALGITDQGLIEMTQKRALDGLAGVAPMPRK
jgi:hypothetical protein